MKLIGGRFMADKRKDCFTQRRVKLWNSLPQDVLLATVTAQPQTKGPAVSKTPLKPSAQHSKSLREDRII